ncbi:hypothetical protein RND71_039603 [Anisodus tanguticus]|uniref:Tubulin/FtsZ GTPase domain-containing protein n=1 Tax=Anisodus tanguticus TaxID=243964 RepID=A0AAE1QZW3_9SOLA|nr:hypothetical protein RND71_039603 [Anisodus tanguticus]
MGKQTKGHDGQLMHKTTEEDDDYTFRTFFSETSSGKFVPRSLFIDLEPTVIDKVKIGTYRQLYYPQQFISGKEDAGNNIARGYYYTLGRKIIDQCLDRIRKLADGCADLSGFVIFNAVGGGTGSVGRKNQSRIYCVSPNDQFSTSIVEPYNSIFASHSLVEHTNDAVLFDNVSVYDIFRRSLDI